jgi:hypothetical protein
MKDAEVARSLLAKLRRFVTRELDDPEAEMFAVLLAPGVFQAYGPDSSGIDGDRFAWPGVPVAGAVHGPDIQWHPDRLAEVLGDALRQGGVRVVGLHE